MSGVAKTLGKVFKKVVKIAKVVLPIALAVGAVVFTGGAALGILPTFSAAIGGVVTSLGIGGAVAGALTGAVVSAGFGSAIGGLTSAAQGKSVIKGMQTGALTGAVTGGVLGAVSPAMFGVVRGADGMWTTANAIRTGSTFGAAGSGNAIARGADGLYSRVGDAVSGGGGTPPGFGTTGAPSTTPPGFGAPDASGQFQSLVDTPGAIQSVDPTVAAQTGSTAAAPAVTTPPGFGATAPAAAGTVPGAVPGAAGTVAAGAAPAAAPAASGGIGGFISQNPMIAGSLLSSVGKAFGGGEEDEYRARYEAEGEEQRRMGLWAYGGVYSGQQNPFGSQAYPNPPPGRWFFNPQTNRVEEVKV